MRVNHAVELRDRLRDPMVLVTALGLNEKSKRQQRGVMILCPVHDERTPSCSVRIGPDGTIQVRCHGCGFSGDALGLVAAVHRWDTRRDFVRILEEAASLCGYDLGRESGPRPPTPVRTPPAPPKRPPAAELESLWNGSLSPSQLGDDQEATLFLVKRNLWPRDIEPLDLVRFSPTGWKSSFAWWPGRWAKAWRLFVRAYDAKGSLRSVQARAVVDVDGPKTRWPLDCRAEGLVFANDVALRMMRLGSPPVAIVVVEGITDTIAMSLAMREEPVAVLGITSGSAPALAEITWPHGVPVEVKTDRDEAGDRYLALIVKAVPDRVEVRRKA